MENKYIVERSEYNNNIVFMQWNILENSKSQGEFLLPENSDYILNWDYRKYSIANNIMYHNPDIITFQEIDMLNDISNLLINYSYACSSTIGGNIAIFYKKHRFLKMDIIEIERRIIIVKLFDNYTGKDLYVVCGHLKSGKADVCEEKRFQQLNLLFKQLEHMIQINTINNKKTNWIIGMDTNADYNYSSSNKVVTLIDEWLSKNNGYNVNSPAYTTFKIRCNNSSMPEKAGKISCHAIDRILYSNSFKDIGSYCYPYVPIYDKNDIETGVVSGIYNSTTDFNLDEFMLPNKICPSDHLYLMANFIYLD